MRKIFLFSIFLFGGILIIVDWNFQNLKTTKNFFLGEISVVEESVNRIQAHIQNILNGSKQNVYSKTDKRKSIDQEVQLKGKEFNGTEDGLIVLINKERFDRELKQLKKNDLLMKSAHEKAKDMIQRKYFEHISPEGLQPWFFAEKNGYRYQIFGENIADKYLSINSVHKAFMDSEGHRKNILNKDFRDVGVAIVHIPQTGEYLVVEHFGSYLKEINLGKDKEYTNKMKTRCNIQIRKSEELTEMLRELKTRKGFDNFVSEIEKIQKNTRQYLHTCQELRDKI